jgi:hypothetical protein
MLDSASRVSVSIVRRTGIYRPQVVAPAPKAISKVSIHTGPQNEPFEAKPDRWTGRRRVDVSCQFGELTRNRLNVLKWIGNSSPPVRYQSSPRFHLDLRGEIATRKGAAAFHQTVWGVNSTANKGSWGMTMQWDYTPLVRSGTRRIVPASESASCKTCSPGDPPPDGEAK